ncbi:MAG TPA: membrane protein insertion efficiency factor YidD [Nitrospira sp.]|nr:membrane protein insertion efficiency factor YidD [Nitrospira sp.]
MHTSARSFCLSLLAAYRYCLSPWLGPACRFEPTCSLYASTAIERFGVVRGIALATCRLLKCHPFHPGGYDPVEESQPRSIPRA